MDKINFDCAATTKIDSNALKAMEGIMLNYFYNPSSHHCGGYEALTVLKKARIEVAKAVGAQEDQIRFTSGGSEGDNWALNIFKLEGIKENKKHIIISAMEHHAITRCCESFKKIGFEITVIKPNSMGLITPEELEKHIKDTTVGVSIMTINNEIGVIQDVEALGAVCHKHSVLFHTDAVQAVPHLLFNLKNSNIDILTASAHKFNGPRGIGFIYFSNNCPIYSFIYGGNQEYGSRAGTENLPAIVGMAVALSWRVKTLEDAADTDDNYNKYKYIVERLKNNVKDFHLTSNDYCVPNIINFYVDGVIGEALIASLSNTGICCSAGSACAAGESEPSHVLIALGLSRENAKNSIRISFDYSTTWREIEFAMDKMIRDINWLKGE